MNNTIKVSGTASNGAQAWEDIHRSYGKQEVAPTTALTIASWWQSSGPVGSVLASFASGAEVDRAELLEDIHKLRLADGYFNGTMEQADKIALDMLSTFIIRYEEDQMLG